MKKASKTEPKSPPKTVSKKAPVKKTTKKIAKKAPAKKVAAAKKTAVSKPKKKAIKTIKIIAKIDIGFGNTLSIRGEGPGLSWEQGVIMDCVRDNEWVWATDNPTVSFPCKFLVNDQFWSTGEDLVAKPGEITIFEPEF